MPVYRGGVPPEMMAAQQMLNPAAEQKPRNIFKRLVENGRIEQMETMQIVSQVQDLNPPDDQPVVVFNPIPSMLHHFDKTNLEQYSLEEIFSRFDQDNANYIV